VPLNWLLRIELVDKYQSRSYVQAYLRILTRKLLSGCIYVIKVNLCCCFALKTPRGEVPEVGDSGVSLSFSNFTGQKTNLRPQSYPIPDTLQYETVS
jgi:hypothetical protein